jgi:hypothetical protein
MFPPRLYRTGLVAVALALIVVAFSLEDGPRPLSTSLVPDAFNGQNAYNSMQALAASFPRRPAGSRADDALAHVVAGDLAGDGFAVSTPSPPVQTVRGRRALINVIAFRPGLSQSTIVIAAPRDALSAPATEQLSGTGVLLELGRVLAGQTSQHSLVLASFSGSAGGGGAAALARELPGPVDAVLVLGDLDPRRARSPAILPFSERAAFAPLQLRATLSAMLQSQAGINAGGLSLSTELTHLMLPLSLTDESPFNTAGEPSVELSLSGLRPVSGSGGAGSAATITGAGQAVLRTFSALDTAGSLPGPESYLVVRGKLVPAWAIRLLSLALILPALLLAIDALARARRRERHIAAWMAAVLGMALPFASAVALLLAARVLGALPAAPPGAVAPGAVPLDTNGILVIAGALLVLGGVSGLRHRLLAPPRSADAGAAWRRDPAVACLFAVLCAVALVRWVSNPYAALLLVPALHLWPWALDPELDWPRPVRLVLWLLGLAGPLLLAAGYALQLGFSPPGMLWSGMLLIVGGQISALTLLEWCVLLGCACAAAAAACGLAAAGVAADATPSIRGPATYAGPGSLGGTKSALRRG